MSPRRHSQAAKRHAPESPSEARGAPENAGPLEGRRNERLALVEALPPSSDVLDDVEPTEEPQDAAQLLNDLVLSLDRYVVVLAPAKVATALFVMHTWAIDAADYTPRLVIRSPVKRCGKTRLLELLTATCRRPLTASSATAAAIFRAVEEMQPTLLLDEGDTFVSGDEGLRAVLNCGFSRASDRVLRCGKRGGPSQSFHCFAPVAIAAIGRLPDTVEDRAIIVEMQRKAMTDVVASFRRPDHEELTRLRPRLTRWALDCTACSDASRHDRGPRPQ